MSDIPSDLYREILVRLPAESLIRLRSVCKTFQNIIDDPSFINAHTSNQIYNHTLLVGIDTEAPLHSFSLDSLNFTSGPQEVDAILIQHLARRIGLVSLPHLLYVALCNGLILLYDQNRLLTIWAIWNPLTVDYRVIPEPNSPLDLTGFGFGYDRVSDDYKVVRIGGSVSSGFQTLVYSLKSDSWSTIEGASQNCPLFKFQPGVFLNGTLYWLSSEGILALDLTTESYSQFALPPAAARKRLDISLSALDGCLILSFPRFYYDWHFDGWVMNDNGVEKSWIELFSQPRSVFGSSPCFGFPFDMEVVAYLKSKRQVVVQHERGYLWFDLESNSLKKFSIHGFPHMSSSQICPGSLVRLGARDNANEFGAVAESSARKRKRKIEKTSARLKFCVRDVGEKCCSDNESCSEDMCRLCKVNEE